MGWCYGVLPWGATPEPKAVALSLPLALSLTLTRCWRQPCWKPRASVAMQRR